jgi:hypothetical protein
VALHVLGWPTFSVAGTQMTEVVDATGEIVRTCPPELAWLFESPEYEAAIVAPPAALVDTATWHEPDASVHIAGAPTSEVVAVPVLCMKVIVPVAPPVGYPFTVAVHVVGEPTTTVEGAQPTKTELTN